MTSIPNAVQREFYDLPSSDKLDMEGAEFLTGFFGSRTVGWSQLLESDRVLIVSEAGMGKTFECRQAQKDRWEAGEAAFFIELADLANAPMEDSLGPKELSRFRDWERAESERAVFFLDSVDEISLTRASFKTALRSVARTLAENLGRACIVITTRPVAVDRELIEEHLPVPESLVIDAAEEFVNAAMRIEKKSDRPGPPSWRYVALAPLSGTQMRVLADQRAVNDVEGLLLAIEARNAQEYAKRPLDFFELCNDWTEHGRIQAHRNQLDESIEIKLRGRRDRKERHALSQSRAREGASQIALAMLLAKKITVWHGSDDDTQGRAAALDPSLVLAGWGLEEVRTLLERPLFGFANYGRVRFHHRSAMEFLAAERLFSLKKNGLPDRTLRELLSAVGPDGTVLIKPSMQAVAAWLARDVSTVRRLLLEHQPSVLLRFGDPESLDSTTRQAALRRYVDKYGMGGWRGQSVPNLQVKRFASKDLGPEIVSLWSAGVTNPEVRETLLELIGEAKIDGGVEIAYDAATNSKSHANDRLNGLLALAKLGDPRLTTLLDEIACATSDWPLSIVSRAIISFFPNDMSVAQLIECLGRLEGQQRRYNGIASHLPIILSKAPLKPEDVSGLREGLYALVSSALSWNEQLHRIVAKRRDLIPALAAACAREIRGTKFAPKLAEASALASILGDGDHHSAEDVLALGEALSAAPDGLREEVFWEICEMVFALGPEKERDARSRSFFIEHQSALRPAPSDASWLLHAASDQCRSLEDRELVLEIAIDLARAGGDASYSMKELQAASNGISSLATRVAVYRDVVENPPPEPDWRRKEAQRQEDAKRKREEDKDSWRNLHRELLHEPDTKFSEGQVGFTLLNLWRVMENAESDLFRPGWNRGFVERVFDKSMADRFREAFAQTWRHEQPSLRSERAADDKNTYMRSWRIGLAGVYAEAESPQWAANLSDADAQLACRYSLIDLNRLPPWVDDLIAAHPGAVDSTIGRELVHDLRDASDFHVMLLQYLRQASSATAAHFVPVVREWLGEVLGREGALPRPDKLRRATEHLLEHGTTDDHIFVEHAAVQALGDDPAPDNLLTWLPLLGPLNGMALVDYIEDLARRTEPAKESAVVRLLGELFGHRSSFRSDAFTEQPALLLRLVRVANQHVRAEDDEHHEGAFSPGARDNAEYSRSALFGMLMDCKGPDAWRIKLTLADDPEAARYRDRVKAIAEEKIASELDSFKLNEKEFARFERDFQYSPKTRREMAALLQTRLDELDDVLKEDGSPRELWADIEHERLLRREIARTLRALAGEAYVAVEESVTADEKETDIRLLSKAAPLEASIELKVGENGYTVRDFESALRDQLVAKYMAPENRRVGALVISWAGRKTWKDPATRKKITFEDLIKRLNVYAQELVPGLGDDAFLVVRGLSLAPRKI